MAANTTRDDGKSAGGPDTTDVEQQLTNLVDLIEAIDWSEVGGIAAAEAAAFATRLDDAQQRTGGPTLATDGGVALPTDGGSGHIEGVIESDLPLGDTSLTLLRWPDTIGVAVRQEQDGQAVGACARLTPEQARRLRDELDAAIGGLDK